MRSIWSCSQCVALLLFALLGKKTVASHAGRQREDVLHRVAKARVTALPARRDEGSCPAAHSLCPASLSGDCCPAGYACAVDSCYATTAGPTTACGRSGYFACAATDGGGCCPVGYVCQTRNECVPPAGVSNTYTQCPNSYHLCPSSFGFGCCSNGMGCAPNACYRTDPVTSTITQTVTTTSGIQTLKTTRTAVTISTPTPPTALPTGDGSDVVAKFIPTSVPKVPASSPSSNPDGGGGGLSRAAIGGIIAGVVILLVVVVVAAFLIIRRLKRVEDVMESRKGSSSGKKTKSQSQTQMEHYGRQLQSPTYLDDMSIDPLMIASDTNNTSTAGTPQPGLDATRRARSDSTSLSPSPNMLHHGAPADKRSRHASPDPSAGYFDVPARVHNVPAGSQQQQQPMTAAAPGQQQHGGHVYHHYHHWRQQSNTSELSADGSDNGTTVHSPLVPQAAAELDASAGYAELPGDGHDRGGAVRSRSSSAASNPGGGGFGHARWRSGGVGVHGPSSGSGGGGGGLGLGPLDEESAEMMHGYHGRRNQQAGQTAAGLDVDWDVSSPVVLGFQSQEPQPPARGA
ncbi:hypothetical protein VTK56DRAFT_8779 [Thermocarpiscus australiensis]